MATNLYLDTEFNGMGGALISLALVTDKDSGIPTWYGVCEHPEPVEWVRENVIPRLDTSPVPRVSFDGSLRHYLQGLPTPIVVHADWPDDFKHLCECLIYGPGQALIPNMILKLVDVKTHPARPHNALSDAFALRDALNGP